MVRRRNNTTSERERRALDVCVNCSKFIPSVLVPRQLHEKLSFRQTSLNLRKSHSRYTVYTAVTQQYKNIGYLFLCKQYKFDLILLRNLLWWSVFKHILSLLRLWQRPLKMNGEWFLLCSVLIPYPLFTYSLYTLSPSSLSSVLPSQKSQLQTKIKIYAIKLFQHFRRPNCKHF